MGCLLALLAGFAPRIALALVWIFSNWVLLATGPVVTSSALGSPTTGSAAAAFAMRTASS